MRHQPDIGLEGLRKATVRILDILAEIPTRHLPRTSQKHYCLSQLVQFGMGIRKRKRK
jgi:hypothetical protein